MSRVASNEEITDSYDLVRALLISRGPEDRGTVSAATERILLNRSHLSAGLLDEAEFHGVAPLLEPMIRAGSKKMLVSVDVQRAFAALASRHRRAARVREASIDQFLAQFAAANIPIILLKGAALAHLIYPSPAFRPMVDIDILIDPGQAERAIRILRDLGYIFASRHRSRFAGRMHHMPAATMIRSGFQITIEVHLNAISPNQSGSLTFAELAERPQPFWRNSGPGGLALGHVDMLRHLAHHAFEPARRVRLIHLYDLWRYQNVFQNEIDWPALKARFPKTMIMLKLVSLVFREAHPETCDETVPAGVGLGMVPLSEIASMGFATRFPALLNPPAWWLHGFYGVPLDRSLLLCRTIRHPAMVVRWLARRLAAVILPPAPLQ